MKKGIMIVLAIWVSMSLVAQDYPGEIKVGDRLPTKELKNMINYSSKTLKFADHNPKLIILDMWATTCGGCVAAWPKILELQKEFGTDLQIILVNRFEDEKTVKEFISYRKTKAGVNMNLPNSVRDTSLWKPFPRRTVPRYYWFDSDGILRSVTTSTLITSANIRKWIESGPFEMDQLIEEMMSVEGNKPIFVDGNGGTRRADAFIWNSALTRAFRDIAGDTQDFTNPLTGYGITSTGPSIEILYGIAYNTRLVSTDYLTWLHASRMKVIAADTGKYFGMIDGVKTSKARYNYQLIAGRPMTRQQLQRCMQADLDRYFGLKATWEKVRKPCLVITMFDSTKAKLKTFGGYSNLVGETQTVLDNATIHKVIFYMEQGVFFYDKRPIIDETGFKGRLTGIKFEAYSRDIKALDSAFSKFGIHIREEVRDVDILVLREPDLAN
jgi:thiol-disulfide isomerase/thioredoxin